jgi:hypothetical protein
MHVAMTVMYTLDIPTVQTLTYWITVMHLTGLSLVTAIAMMMKTDTTHWLVIGITVTAVPTHVFRRSIIVVPMGLPVQIQHKAAQPRNHLTTWTVLLMMSHV